MKNVISSFRSHRVYVLPVWKLWVLRDRQYKLSPWALFLALHPCLWSCMCPGCPPRIWWWRIQLSKVALHLASTASHPRVWQNRRRRSGRRGPEDQGNSRVLRSAMRWNYLNKLRIEVAEYCAHLLLNKFLRKQANAFYLIERKTVFLAASAAIYHRIRLIQLSLLEKQCPSTTVNWVLSECGNPPTTSCHKIGFCLNAKKCVCQLSLNQGCPIISHKIKQWSCFWFQSVFFFAKTSIHLRHIWHFQYWRLKKLPPQCVHLLRSPQKWEASRGDQQVDASYAKVGARANDLGKAGRGEWRGVVLEKAKAIFSASDHSLMRLSPRKYAQNMGLCKFYQIMSRVDDETSPKAVGHQPTKLQVERKWQHAE